MKMTSLSTNHVFRSLEAAKNIYPTILFMESTKHDSAVKRKRGLRIKFFVGFSRESPVTSKSRRSLSKTISRHFDGKMNLNRSVLHLKFGWRFTCLRFLKHKMRRNYEHHHLLKNSKKP